jgi:2-C-methyl-D-erythritol 4-phosphate cytidylyltransferase
MVQMPDSIPRAGRAAPAPVLAVVPIVGRADLAAERFGGRTLLERAITTASAAAQGVLVVADDADRVASHVEAEWFAPHSDGDLLDRVAHFDRLLVHDLLCPLTPAAFLRELAAANTPASVAVSPLVDTVKELSADGVVQRTVDRDRLVVVASPVIVRREILAQVPEILDALRDLAMLVERLRAVTDVAVVAAPSSARRVSDLDDLRVLELRQSA